MEGGPERDLTVLFALSGAPRDVPQVLNPSIVIVWIQLRVLSLRMLSAGLYLSLLHPNLFITRLQMTVSEELLTPHNHQQFSMFCST